MKHDIDFTKFVSMLDALFYGAAHLAEWVMLYPQQVTAGCLLYLCFTKFLGGLRRSK
jgi:hypothetical protein